MSDAPRRVRVTADAGPARPRAGRGAPGGRAPIDRVVRTGGAAASSEDAYAVYDRALRRSQLRLALGTTAGVVVVMTVLTLVIATIPDLDRVTLGGIPLSWLLHAFAFYPVIFAFSLLYARAARRNEQRYLALRERE